MPMTKISWQQTLSRVPLVAILRGIEPSDVLNVATALEQAGMLCLEIPLNSPDPLASIERLKDHFNGRLLVGAGTVLTVSDVEAVRKAGAEFVVSPNMNPAVIRATKSCGLISLPGFMTPTEAFAAIEAGADALKLFPAEAAPPAVLKALKSVLPAGFPVIPVGGITSGSMADYLAAGAAGFGIGSAIYKRGVAADAVRARAEGFVTAWHSLRG
jgi:2-dehydro-3-deoxyphosphogalactonate aldolase